MAYMIAEFTDRLGTSNSRKNGKIWFVGRPEQEDIEDKGGTMRLGAYPCKVAPGTRAFDAYGSELIYERHRHRYEVSNVYRDQLSEAGNAVCQL